MSNQSNARLYLFTLEVAPLEVSKTYNPLPSHLTLMPRFWSELTPEEIVKLVTPLFQKTQPVELTFGETALFGPQKKLAVHLVENTPALKELHTQLMNVLDTAGVTYTTPQWLGENHRSHVTKREGTEFENGHQQIANAAYLIEVEIQGTTHLRFVRAKFDLTA